MSRDETAARLAGSLPDEKEDLLAFSAGVVEAFNAAVLADDFDAAMHHQTVYGAIVWKLNGGTFFGCANGDQAPASVVAARNRAAPGEVPGWGQPGGFIIEVNDTRVWVEFSGLWGGSGSMPIHFEFRAVDLNGWFISETGYRSYFSDIHYGLTVAETAHRAVAGLYQSKRFRISERRCDELMEQPLPAWIEALEPPPCRRHITKAVPDGFERVDVVLPSHKAFLVRKWHREALKKLQGAGV